MSRPRTQLKPMQLVKQRYRIICQGGKGGSGTVYQAEDTLLNLLVALKEVGEDADQVLQVRHEARLLTQFKHDSIPSFIDLVEEKGRWYLVMEWIEGVHVWGRKPLPIKQVVWFGEQVCDVLSYLHHCQPPIIHRDIKPANILLNDYHRLHLLDFGISCSPGPNVNTAGSVRYAAPEQWVQGTPITPLADIYSLGVVLLQFLVGEKSAQDDSTTQARNLVPRKTDGGQRGYGELTDLLARMTANEAGQRPDIEQVWQELEQLDAFLRMAE